jgi:hypothetical protein
MNAYVFDNLLEMLTGMFLNKYRPAVCGIRIDIGVCRVVSDDIARYSVLNNVWLRRPVRWDGRTIKKLNHRSRIYKKWILKKIRQQLRASDGDDSLDLLDTLNRRRATCWGHRYHNYEPFAVAMSQVNRMGYLRKLIASDRDNIKKTMFGLDR